MGHVNPKSNEWSQIKNFILSTQTTDRNNLRVKNIFAIRRPVEQLDKTISNEKLLFHGSRACNFVGLLSRGILMPKIVVSRGGGRTDAGLLGNGIYFSDSVTTVAQYAYPDSKGSRYVLVNRVCLGNVKDYTDTQIGLEEPPHGFQSVHGISQRTFASSAFKDDEFVVFKTNQQVQEYLLEFEEQETRDLIMRTAIQPSSPPDSFFTESQPADSSNSYSTPSWSESVESSAFDRLVPPSFQFGSSFEETASPSSSFGLSSYTTAPTTSSNFGFSSSSSLSSTGDDIQATEEKYRRMFIEDRHNQQLQDPYLNLVDVMANLSSFGCQAPSNEEGKWPTLLDKYMKEKAISTGTRTVCDQSSFESNWKAWTENQFAGMNWDNVFVAGGAVLACMQPDFSTSTELNNPFHSADIDIFLYGLTPSQANQKLKDIYQVVKRNSGNSGSVIRTQHAVTILGEYPYRHTQIILRIYKSPAEVLMGFDIDSCCVGYDGQRVLALPRARRALTKRHNLVDLSRRSLTYETRLHKYSQRGFGVWVPGFDESKVNDNLFQRQVSDVQGLAKLLILDRIQRTGQASTRGKAARTNPD